MGLAAGEVLHGGAEGIGGEKANVDLHASAHAKADFIFAAGDDVHQTWQLDDVVNQLLPFFIVTARFAGYEDVEIAHRFASPTQRTGGRDVFDAGISAEVLDDFFSLSFGCVEEEAAGDAAIILDRF